MGLLVEQNKVVILPPKNGTHTVNAVVAEMGLTHFCDGHIEGGRLRKMIARSEYGAKPLEWGIHIRNPFDRFVSAVNYVFGYNDKTLGYALEQVIDHPGRIYRNQLYWVEDAPANIRLFDSVPALLKWIGWERRAPREGVGDYQWTAAEIKMHNKFEAAFAPFTVDYELRTRACTTN